MARFTPKQTLFIAHYLETLNASEAARRAGYSARTAGAIGHENLKKPKIQEEIKRLMAQAAMSPEEVLLRLTNQARADFGSILSNKGYIDLDALKGAGALIKSVRITDKGITVTMLDPQKALELLGRHHELFKDKVELDIDGPAIIIDK